MGVMDADVYGPNIPRMFGVNERPAVIGGKIQPLEAYGVKLMSLGLLIERDAPAIWRGPIIMKIMNQFLRDVDWGQLDYFIVDLPPGNRRCAALAGPGHPCLRRRHRDHAAGSGGGRCAARRQDVRAGRCAGARCGREHERVHRSRDRQAVSISSLPGGGQRLADEIGVPLLGTVPLQPQLAALADAGQPILIAQPDSPAAVSLREIAETLQQKTAGRSASLPILEGGSLTSRPDLSIGSASYLGMPIITLLTDFGSADHYVAEVKGVLLSRAPDATLVDVTHGIPPGDVRSGAYVLGRTWHRFPAGTIHLAVVDPGVGTTRGRARALLRAATSSSARTTGVFTPVLHDAEVEAVVLSRRRKPHRPPSMAVTCSLPPRRRWPMESRSTPWDEPLAGFPERLAYTAPHYEGKTVVGRWSMSIGSAAWSRI